MVVPASEIELRAELAALIQRTDNLMIQLNAGHMRIQVISRELELTAARKAAAGLTPPPRE